MAQITEIPLPKRWPDHVKSAVLHTISLTSTVFMSAQGWTAKRADRLVRLQTELDNAKSENALITVPLNECGY
ncbi:hypothetical protein ACFLU6_14010 [Acidobacteriota bacterium]